MRVIAVLLAASVGLSGCAMSAIQKEMDSLTGQHVDVLISKLGLPSGEAQVAGRRVLIWSTDATLVLPQTSTSNTYGSVGSTPYYGTTTHTSYNATQLSCTIKVSVDHEMLVQYWEAEGQQGACQRFASRLKR